MKKLAYATPIVLVQFLQEELVRTSGIGAEEVGTTWEGAWIL